MTSREVWLKSRIRSVLLATDLHQNSRLAFDYAAELAHRFGCKLSALHAFEFGPHSQAVEVLDHLPSMERKNAEEALAAFIRETGETNVLPQVVVVETFVTTAIVKALSEHATDLLVIGTEGVHDGISHFILGSNTEALMLGSRRLTLTVGPRVPQNSGPPMFKKVLYISDFGIASTAAASYAFALGEAYRIDTEVYQLASKTAREDGVRLKTSAAQYCDILRFPDPDLPASWFDPDFQISRIVPEHDLTVAISEPSNLIVLGVQPATFLQRHLHTSQAYKLVANAASPVLTVPAEAAGTLRDQTPSA